MNECRLNHGQQMANHLHPLELIPNRWEKHDLLVSLYRFSSRRCTLRQLRNCQTYPSEETLLLSRSLLMMSDESLQQLWEKCNQSDVDTALSFLRQHIVGWYN